MTDPQNTAEKVAALLAAHVEVMDRFPALVYERDHLRNAGIEPTGVLVPARLNVSYEGDDATDSKGSCMGLPITWSDDERWGLIVMLPEPRTRTAPPEGTDS